MKIAYEFAVDSLPDFINDKNAIIISEILLNQDISRLSTIQFIGDGFENIIQPVFGNLIDFQIRTDTIFSNRNRRKTRMFCEFI